MEPLKEAVKTRVRRFCTPRTNTDLQSEVIDRIAGPIYFYTISYVVYFGYSELTDYHYGLTDGSVDGDGQPWLWYFQKCLASMIYFQMMANWLCIRYVDTSLKTAVKNSNLPTEKFEINKFTIPGNEGVKLKSDACSTTEQSKHCADGGVSKRGKSATRVPASSPAPRHLRISYWSWKPCLRCHLNAPPRCHHCSLCGICTLKRDHHCFFAGRCVGFFNQRHFIVFLVWAAFGTTYAMVHFLPYLYHVVLQDISAWDCFAPIAVLKLLFGFNDLYHVNLVCSFTLNFFFILLSSAFLYEQYNLVAEGVTQFEQTKVDRRKLKIVDPRPLSDKIRAVLGEYPAASLMFPWAHWYFPPKDNPFEWPEHKISHN